MGIWCCSTCCKAIEENPTASFAELRCIVGSPLVEPEEKVLHDASGDPSGSGGGGGSSIDAERESTLLKEIEELKAALASSKQAEQPPEQASGGVHGGDREVKELLLANKALLEKQALQLDRIAMAGGSGGGAVSAARVAGEDDEEADSPSQSWSPQTGADALVPEGGVLYSGPLDKRGGGTSVFGRKNWKRRWFILHKNLLRYFSSEESAAISAAPPLGEIPMAGATVQFGSERLVVLSFPSGRRFEIRCVDDQSHGEWKSHLIDLAALKLQAP